MIVKDAITGLSLAPHAVNTRRDGSDLYLTTRVPLDPVVSDTSVWLERYARQTPDALAVAERAGEGWREITYGALLPMVQAIGAALAGRGYGAHSPIAILSGNSIDHLLLSLGAQYVGVPTVPLAEQYALITEAHGRLIYVLEKVRPAAVFVDDAARYAAALALPNIDGMEILASRTEGAPRPVTAFETLLAGDPSVDLAARHATVGPDTVAKILFTSGSSSDPKGVLTTQRMMCANQAQMASVLPFLKERAHRITDWLPWNHVFGGSHNVNMMLSTGGTLTIDAGKPTKALFGETVRSLIERPGTLSFNVPVGFALLVQEMEENRALRQAYFEDLDMIFYAGASLPQDVWRDLEEMATEVRGAVPLMNSSWGLTETGPACLIQHEPTDRSGIVGVPMTGVSVKLVPDDDTRFEVRVKGPNIMTGYHGAPEKTAEAFDEEGYFKTGDAMAFVDPNDMTKGLRFDGRISEDFKLLTGTWVRAAQLRLDALIKLAPLAADVVVTGEGHNEVGLLIVPSADTAARLTPDNGAMIGTDVQAEIAARLADLAKSAAGSSNRIARALIMAEPPSIADGEITAKGNLNFRKLLTRRADLLDRLYSNTDSAVIRV